ncbi:toxin-antitoxin system, toxin component [Streptomyces sp. ISL-94]|uniref:toxin-antitoxin system, toxin component n=1 Tax=Streptomyces sp. ISL-94 TaxID=2819190 RepID=UPI001BE9A45E|nr:toxin-antitoxin system, toxin component [Streptomyces sp. ISL-94]MBT2482841.1 toxin-antitoxin system, toxin component [Streptomyces sp. ISL-94]
MRTTRAMRRLADDLLADAGLTPPADVTSIIGGVCEAYGRRRGGGRKVDFRFASFPPDTASGLWLEMEGRDLLVIEERTRPEHQLVIACHELWHVDEGTCHRHGPGMAVAARLTAVHGDLAGLLRTDTGLGTVIRQAAARADREDREDPAETRAEIFGLHLGKLLKPYLPPPRAEQFPEAIERINTSLGWGRPASPR